MMNSREIIIPAASPDYAEIIPQSEKKRKGGKTSMVYHNKLIFSPAKGSTQVGMREGRRKVLCSMKSLRNPG